MQNKCVLLFNTLKSQREAFKIDGRPVIDQREISEKGRKKLTI